METYDETLASLTQKRDWFKSGQIILARRSTHKTAWRQVSAWSWFSHKLVNQTQDPLTICLQYPRLSALETIIDKDWIADTYRSSDWVFSLSEDDAVVASVQPVGRSYTFTLSFLSITVNRMSIECNASFREWTRGSPASQHQNIVSLNTCSPCWCWCEYKWWLRRWWHCIVLKVKVCFYIVQYPVRWTTQRALHVTRWQTCSFWHQLDFSGKHSGHATLTREDYSFTFPPPSIASTHLYSWVNWGIVEKMKIPKLWNGREGYSNPGSLDCESGILLLSYSNCAAQSLKCSFFQHVSKIYGHDMIQPGLTGNELLLLRYSTWVVFSSNLRVTNYFWQQVILLVTK